MKLGITWRERKIREPLGQIGGVKAARRYLDFTVNDVSLSDLLQASSYDLIGVLGWADLQFDELVVRELVLEAGDAATIKRVPIYVCAECGDLSCGAITAAISRHDETYVWADFAYENDYDPEVTERTPFADVGSLVFPSNEYQQVLLMALERNADPSQLRDAAS